MKVLWLCNVVLPMIARQLNMEATNKEGWISGLAAVVLEKRAENGIELAVAFPAPEEAFSQGGDVFEQTVSAAGGELVCYGFREDTANPHLYDGELEKRLGKILALYKPDLVHCFGTEYPHTLAMCRIFPHKDRLLIGIQGLCAVYAHAYFADLPEKAVNTVTLRDYLKKDNLKAQQKKFIRRGVMETEAVKLAGNVAGRTEWDRFYTREWNPAACYYEMNETLRPEFYGAEWNRESCEKHSIFLSQGDYPVKGLHYMLAALPAIRDRYPDVKVYVAGQNLTQYDTIIQKLKISGYGKYLRGLIQKYRLKEHVLFVGKLDSARMKEQYLKCGLFVCPSSIENSPNSLGEAMLLGMPCVSADVGGIPGIFSGGKDGILYEGFRCGGLSGFYGKTSRKAGQEDFPEASDRDREDGGLGTIAKRLSDAVIQMWSDENKMAAYCKNAKIHAEQTHDRSRNYERLCEVYVKIMEKSGSL